MTINDDQALLALAAAASIIRELQHDLRTLSSGERNPDSDRLGAIDIDIEKLRGKNIGEVVAWIDGEQHRLSQFVSRDDIVQNCALEKAAWLLTSAKNSLMHR